MIVNSDLHLQYARDRQERLLGEAAAHRLAGSLSTRISTRVRAALFLRRAADRLDTATGACGVGGPLTEPS